jgi:hypothetical protein
VSNHQIPTVTKNGLDVALEVLRTAILGRQQVAAPCIVTARPKCFANHSGKFTGDQNFHRCPPQQILK